MRPSTEYSYERAKKKLVDLHVGEDEGSRTGFMVPGDDDTYNHQSCVMWPGFSSHQGSVLRLSTRVDFDSHLSIGCAGAVLTYLERRRAVRYLPDQEDSRPEFFVSAIETLSLDGIM